MTREYPVLPSPLALFDVLTGVFDPVTSTPHLQNGHGAEGQRYLVSRAGIYDFITGTSGTGTALNAGDELIYTGGVFETIRRGASGDYLPRDGTLPLTGPLDTDAHPILLRDGLLQGDSDAARAVIRYVQLAGGTWTTRSALIQVRARALGDPSTIALLPGELASDITLATPSLLVGINGAGDALVLVGPTRQLELADVDQVALGHKTFRELSFGSDIHLPVDRGDIGQALIQQADGEVVWGSVQLSADVVSIALVAPGATVVDSFNASGPFTFGQSTLAFITWQSAVYVWSGGPGTFGLGTTPATPDDIVGPILTFAGIAFADLGEAQSGTGGGKAIDPPVAVQAYVVKDSDDPQTILSSMVFSGLGSIQAPWQFLSGGSLNFSPTAKLTIQDAPRAGSPGLKDAVNRSSLDSRFQPTSASTGAPAAGLGAILDAGGQIDRAILPLAVPLDFFGGWSPLAPGSNLLKNGAPGGGCTPPAFPGRLYYAIADGRWNFTTGAADPSGFQVTTGMLLILGGDGNWFALVTPGSGGGGSSTSLPRDGSLPMTGNLSFATGGLVLSGAGPTAQLALQNVIIDGGGF